ncbi:hypothetical protein MTR67_039649 [Solanum verrucosum]|uniref:Tf2-1-like SH3-like domain-containing protein n=1 Tax=Solanum verrucosum TaxID=315347 RepID=A0AAF0ZRD9_SOLVR|nr:hypothetical protein MTR67_039649 [Solanum verrucosum]
MKLWRRFDLLENVENESKSTKKSYANVRRRDLEFDVPDWVYLKISPMKGVMRFSKKGKLSPRYVDPYQILRHVGKVAYKQDLSNEFALVHPVFHVSMLKKIVGDPTFIVPLEGLGVKENFSYEEAQVEIFDRQVKKLRNKEVASVKVFWRNQLVEGATWEAEADMIIPFEDECSQEGDIVTPRNLVGYARDKVRGHKPKTETGNPLRTPRRVVKGTTRRVAATTSTTTIKNKVIIAAKDVLAVTTKVEVVVVVAAMVDKKEVATVVVKGEEEEEVVVMEEVVVEDQVMMVEEVSMTEGDGMAETKGFLGVG